MPPTNDAEALEPTNPRHERTKRLRLPVSKEVLEKIRAQCPHEGAAVELRSHFTVNEAVAIIDNLGALSSSFLLTYFLMLAHPKRRVGKPDQYAIDLIARAVELRIRGTYGLPRTTRLTY